MYVTILVGS